MAIWIVLPILTLLMFDLGLTLRLEDFSKVFRRPWPLAVAIASSPFIFANERMAIPAILYSLMMNIVLLTYVAVVRKQDQ
jgi:BASS family bile acid:Na+ symporter